MTESMKVYSLKYHLIPLTLIFVSALLLYGCKRNSKKIAPKVVKGVIDLRNWDFATEGDVLLDGDWELYNNSFLKNSDFDTLASPAYTHIPGHFNGLVWHGKTVSRYGFLTIRLKILLPDKCKRLGMSIPRVTSAYRLFINDALAASSGQLAKDREGETAEWKPVYSYFDAGGPENNIVIQISNFHYRHIGLGFVYLGTMEQVSEKRVNNIISDVFLVGMNIFFIFFLISLFIYQSKDKSLLYFAVFCSCILLRILVTGEMLIKRIWPSIPFELDVKIELASVLLAGYLLIIYLKLIMREIIPDWYSKIIVWIFTLIMSAFIFFNARFSSFFVTPMQITFGLSGILICFMLIKNLNKKEGANWILIATISTIISLVTELLKLKGIISFAYPVPVSFIALYMFSVVFIAKRSGLAIKKIENFADELEVTVEERTNELKIEKEKSDLLLLNVLPEPIAGRLKEGEAPIADFFEEASVVFVDIVNFTDTSSRFSPRDVVHMLNEIFTIFDKVSAKYGLEKIKTIGDCYMAAAGIPQPRQDHARAALQWALEVNEITRKYSYQPKEASSPNEPVKIQFRTGLNCGSIVAGVIGEQKFIYDLWGDMVNSASRMESNSIPGKIQCTNEFKEKLMSSGQVPGIVFTDRGEIEIKGKGRMRTWFIDKSESNQAIS